MDIEAPIDAGHDVRLTMFDVILVKKSRDLKVTKRLGKNYAETITVPTPASPLTSTRGWTAADVTFKGKKLRFANTHLEAFADAPREAQAREFVGPGGPLRTGRQLIVTGDMNSDPQGRESPAGAFDILAGGGLVDAWPKRLGPGYHLLPRAVGRPRSEHERVRPPDRPDLREAEAAHAARQGRRSEALGPRAERPVAVGPRRRRHDAAPALSPACGAGAARPPRRPGRAPGSPGR